MLLRVYEVEIGGGAKRWLGQQKRLDERAIIKGKSS
jgi:hypothetical protein